MSANKHVYACKSVQTNDHVHILLLQDGIRTSKKEPVYWSPISVTNRDDSQGGIRDKYVVENFSGVKLLDGFTIIRWIYFFQNPLS